MTEYEWEETGIPPRYRGEPLEGCPKPASDNVRNFCLGKGTDMLVVTGGNGTAKTRTACASFTERISSGFEPGLYLSCKYQLCPMFRSSRLSGFGTSEYDLYVKYYRTPYLVIDEYGKGDDSRLERAVVRSILSARYDNGLLTCLVTNLSMQELVSDGDVGLGADIRSRLKETATVIAMDGADWRESNRQLPHREPSTKPVSEIRCIICGAPMRKDGICSNPSCVACC